MSSKKLIIGIVILAIIGAGVFALFGLRAKPIVVTQVQKIISPTKEIIGASVQGRNIEAYTYLPAEAAAASAGSPEQASASGLKQIIFVGGIHGGYEWNGALLAYQLMDYLNANPQIIPANEKITVIPDLNPDGVFKVTGKEGRFTSADVTTDQKILASGRFNANNVDLNRNFDCNWKSTGTWQNKIVSAGTAAFSEPESAAIRDYVLKNNPIAVIFFHSQSNGVYASQCNAPVLPGTIDIMNAYSKASRYPPYKTFDAYAVNGASGDWLASINIPSVDVELKTHQTVEFDQNLTGVKAILGYYGQK